VHIGVPLLLLLFTMDAMVESGRKEELMTEALSLLNTTLFNKGVVGYSVLNSNRSKSLSKESQLLTGWYYGRLRNSTP
jgi:hypothetical protein